MKLYQNSVSPMYSVQISVSNIFVFQTSQHFNQSKLVISGPYSNSSSCMQILV